MKAKVLLCIILFTQIRLTAQELTTEQQPEAFSVSLEFRPRAELRNGYRQLRTDTTTAAFFVSQRSRLNIQYQRTELIFYTSFQDVRVWGEDDPREKAGFLQVFEAYIEPVINQNFAVRVGRQRIMYDNQRLFAQNDWRQNARSHDAVRLIYKTQKLEAELTGAFNQLEENLFNTDYVGLDNYKVLVVSYLKYRLSEPVTFTTINVADGFSDKAKPSTTHFRFTNGGRIAYEENNLYLTLAGYYQHGKTPSGIPLSAFYFQPEIALKTTPRTTMRLGAEIFSGDNGRHPEKASHSFDALYGVNHRFLGTMDYFTRFPADFNHAGIIDPYLFFTFDLSEKLSLKVDNHLFYSENNLVINDQVVNKYLGYENDIVLSYLPNDYTTLDFGFSWMLPEGSMEIVKNGGNSDKTPYWSYFMITFKPNLFKWTSNP